MTTINFPKAITKGDTTGRLMLKGVRIAFPKLFEPDQFQGAGAFRCGAQFIVDPATPGFELIEQTINEVAKAAWKDKWEKTLKAARASDSVAMRDGDNKDIDGYEGMFAISASCKGHEDADKAARPNVFDKQRNLVKSERDSGIYGGCYVNASIEFYAMSKYGNQINATLRGVQFAAEGDAFGSAPAKADEFDEVAEGTDAGDFA